MIGVKLMGGLGNQMFQYAIGRKMSLKNRTNLALDLTFYSNQTDDITPRHYELGCFKLKPKLITKEAPTRKGILKIISKQPFTNTYNEKHFHFDPTALDQPDGTVFNGYWQTDKYFSDIRKELLDDFTITTPLSIDDQKVFDDITNETSVSLHVRRGDYVTNKSAAKFHGLKGIDYYKKGLELIGSHTPSFKLFVFSDDIEWCKSQLSDIWDNIVFVDGKREGYMDMHLMKHCSHNIVANSSFSWWAAWLNQNESKVIVAPKNWFNDAKTNTKDVVPKAWHRI